MIAQHARRWPRAATVCVLAGVVLVVAAVVTLLLLTATATAAHSHTAVHRTLTGSPVVGLIVAGSVLLVPVLGITLAVYQRRRGSRPAATR